MATCECCRSNSVRDLDTLDRSFRSALIQCLNCGHIQVEPVPNGSFLEQYYAGFYGTTRNIDDEALLLLYAFRAIAQFKYIFTRVESIQSVCDFGCGYGVFLQKCLPHIDKHKGFEQDSLCIKYCQQKHLNVVNASYYYESSDIYDLTVMSHVLEHIVSPSQLLNIMQKRTQYLFIEIPAIDTAYSFTGGGHLHFFSENSIVELLQSTGFNLINISRWGMNMSVFYDDDPSSFPLSTYSLENKDGIWIRILAASCEICL